MNLKKRKTSISNKPFGYESFLCGHCGLVGIGGGHGAGSTHSDYGSTLFYLLIRHNLAMPTLGTTKGTISSTKSRPRKKEEEKQKRVNTNQKRVNTNQTQEIETTMSTTPPNDVKKEEEEIGGNMYL